MSISKDQIKIINSLVPDACKILASKVEGVYEVRDVKVSFEEEECTVDLYITMLFGHKIPDTAWSIQNTVKDGLKSDLDYDIDKINIHIQGVSNDKKRS